MEPITIDLRKMNDSEQTPTHSDNVQSSSSASGSSEASPLRESILKQRPAGVGSAAEACEASWPRLFRVKCSLDGEEAVQKLPGGVCATHSGQKSMRNPMGLKDR